MPTTSQTMDEATALQMAGRAARGDNNALGSVLRALILGQCYRTNAGSPQGSLTPRNIGERVFDTTNSTFYVATGTTTTSWTAEAKGSETMVIPLPGPAKVGATAGWVITAGTNIGHATLPASQTNSTLVVSMPDLNVGDTITGWGVGGQVESAGGNVTLTGDLRKLTNAAADNTDASLSTDNVGTLTADTIISQANLGATGLTEVVAADESFYLLLTGTTAALTDIDLTHVILQVRRG
jgi:hypothetical protein